MTRRSWAWDFRPLAEIRVAIDELLHEITEIGAADVLPEFPHTEIRTTERGYEVVAAVPGMKREELKLSVDGQTIRLGGERVLPLVSGAEPLRSERFAGAFDKSVDVPADADLTRIRARLADGLLTIEAPYRTDTETTHVEIDVEDV